MSSDLFVVRHNLVAPTFLNSGIVWRPHHAPEILSSDRQEARMLAAIHSEPSAEKNTLNHLVYADWLEEHAMADAATAQRMAAIGFHWKAITPSTVGLLIDKRCLAMIQLTRSNQHSVRQWSHVNLQNQTYWGVAENWMTSCVAMQNNVAAWYVSEN